MPSRIAAAADAGHHDIRQSASRLQDLRSRLLSNDRLELADHQRIGMRPEHRAEQVVRRIDVGDPVAHRLVDRVLQRPASGIHLLHRRAQHPHAEHVQRLARHVFGAHVDDALQAQKRAGRRGRDAVLTRTGLGHDPALSHAHGQQRLSERVVDLVRARCARDPRASERDARPTTTRRAGLRREESDARHTSRAGAAAPRETFRPCGPRRTPRQARRPAPSAFPARSVRRTRRSSLEHRDRAGRKQAPASRVSTGSRVLRDRARQLTEKGAQPLRALHARRGFHTR